ncbi:MAG: efflux RND transporter periplasmic adaptor subunit [Ignavibacteriae bacterium]|nr:efflux RND transporter periplasmic adaptor subunit [Ignavibacteriota bacterium]
MKNKIIIGLIIMAVLTGGVLAYQFYFRHLLERKEQVTGELYICPMHPQIQEDHPGVCPICNMELVLKGSGETMNGMEEYGDDANHELGEIKLSPSEVVLANVQTTIAKYGDFDFSLQADGVVRARDDAYRQISSPVAGKIMRQYIDYEGQWVRKGQRAFEIYSPELVATQKEYILAYKNMMNVKNSEYTRVYENAKSIVDATKERLKLWFITDRQIVELEESGQVRNSLTYYADYSGVVTKKYVNEGSWVTEGMTIADVVNLGSVWVVANVYENELGSVRVGQYVNISLSGYSDQTIRGRIDYINPFINPETRTAEVRITTSNPNMMMKPGMFVKVGIETNKTSRYIVVPRNSVLRTGKEDIIYIKKGDNVFAPRKVIIGGERDRSYLISSGINEGDVIVTSAGFLLDSESRIRTGNMDNHKHDNMDMNGNEPKINKDQDAMKDMENKR